MSLTIPHVAATAALVAIASSLSTASTTDATIGRRLQADLTQALASWTALAMAFNTADAAYPGLVSDAIDAANRAADAVQAIHPFVEPASGAAVDRLGVAFRASGPSGSVSEALIAALTDMDRIQRNPPTAPDDSVLLALVSRVSDFTLYLDAA